MSPPLLVLTYWSDTMQPMPATARGARRRQGLRRRELELQWNVYL